MFQELIDQGLVKEKKYPNGLSVFKYTRRVFFDSLWDQDDLLMEARGMVLDAEGNKVIWPFTKVFNYGERDTGLDVPDDKEVDVVWKINGFMAAATDYKGELIVSTTGTLDSEFAAMARDYIEELDTSCMLIDHTYIFEICSPDDPHIVQEVEGAYLIGMRDMQDGRMFTEEELDHEALILGALRPEHIVLQFRAAKAMVKTCRHEGYMIRDVETGATLMKIKSPHYLIKKFLMRLGQRKMEVMFEQKAEFLKFIDEEFYPIVHYITRWFTLDTWKALTEQERRAVIEEYFNEIA